MWAPNVSPAWLSASMQHSTTAIFMYQAVLLRAPVHILEADEHGPARLFSMDAAQHY